MFNELIPIFYKLFPKKLKGSKFFQTHSTKASIALVLKTDKDTTTKDYKTIALMDIDVNIFNKILAD
jgi:hypothetical protein